MQLEQTISAARRTYYEYLGAASSQMESAHDRLDRVMAVMQHPAGVTVSSIANRVDGAVRQADQAMRSLAVAEHYRSRSSAVIPGATIDFVSQAVQDIETGSRALRRATALLTDPDVFQDIVGRKSLFDAIGIGQSHFDMATWLIRNAPVASGVGAGSGYES